MIDEVLSKLIEFLQQVSPMVWNTLVRQVYINAFMQLAWGMVFLIIFCMSYRYWMHYNKMYVRERKERDTDRDDDSWDMRRTVSAVVSIMTGFTGVALSVGAIGMLANPYYHAITDIINTISGK